MGNFRSPHDCTKEMDSTDRESCLVRPELPGPKRRQKGQGKTAESTGDIVTHEESEQTDIKESEKKIHKETCVQSQSLPGKSKKKSFSNILLVIPLLIILFAIRVFGAPYLTKNADNSVHFDIWFKQMENDFPEEFDYTWQVLNKSLKKFLKETTNSLEPNVILMLGTGDNRDTVNCLSDRVKTIVRDVFEDEDCPGIKSEELVKSNDTILKLEMEKKMNHTLTERKCHALVIEDIDLLREAGLNLLQPYCDHENAPHKFVSIILTATTKKKPPLSLPKNKHEALYEFQKMVREHLNDAWKTAHSDYRDAWLSRFMKHIVVMGGISPPSVCANKH